MTKRRNLVWLLLAGLSCGCNNDDVDRLGRVARTVASKFDGLTEGAQGKLVGGWQAPAATPISDLTLEGRVAGRIRWDQRLEVVAVRVDAIEPGVIRLRGTVEDLEQRRRAVDLAETTAGVERVVDELTTGE